AKFEAEPQNLGLLARRGLISLGEGDDSSPGEMVIAGRDSSPFLATFRQEPENFLDLYRWSSPGED
ncbi:hypothetical protein A2U01_0026601, partial [Trifolium medium]|nr:hypothetical protein [Trifolium medium]